MLQNELPDLALDRVMGSQVSGARTGCKIADSRRDREKVRALSR